MTASAHRKWLALALLCAVQFVVISTTEDALAKHTAVPVALTDRFVNVFWAGAAIAFVDVLLSILLVRGRDHRLSAPASEDAVAVADAAVGSQEAA